MEKVRSRHKNGEGRSNFKQMTWMRVRSRSTEKCRIIMSQLLSRQKTCSC